MAMVTVDEGGLKWLKATMQANTAVAGILKARFPNLQVAETVSLSNAIVAAVLETLPRD